MLQCGTVLCFIVSPSSCAFITFEKMESADQAVAEVGTVQYKRNLRGRNHIVYDLLPL